jgi:2-polyprenyl-3-methyl-5-hydroxy-6-metoxy-1,4-benzoquinol methylase
MSGAPNCPSCGGASVAVGRRSDYGQLEGYAPFVVNPGRLDREIVRCTACGLAFITPMYGAVEFAALYGDPRYADFQELISPITTDLDSPRSRRMLEIWANNFVELGVTRWRDEHAQGRRPTMLDLGCGLGRNLVVFKDLGFDVTGLETNEKEATFVRDTLRLPVVHQTMEAYAGSGQRYDYVLASHFIEHVTDPHAFVETAKGFLAPKGLLLVETPLLNDHGLTEQRFRDVYHTLFFDHFSLFRLAAAHGLEAVGVKNLLFGAEVDGSHNLYMLVAFAEAEGGAAGALAGVGRAAYDALLSDAIGWSRSHLIGEDPKKLVARKAIASARAAAERLDRAAPGTYAVLRTMKQAVWRLNRRLTGK